MRKLAFILFVLGSVHKLSGQSAGPNNSTAITNGGSGQIAQTWSNPNLARTQNDQYATLVTPDDNERTEYLQAQNFGFNIPAGSSINGIVVEIDRYATVSGGNVTDARVRIIDATGSIITGSDKSTSLQWPSTDTDTYQSYGGITDTWSITDWTSAKINNSNFGVAIQARTSNNNTTFNLFVDEIRITVYYTASGSQRYAVASGNWTSTSTWATTPGGTPGASEPTLADDVFIGGGFTVTVNSDNRECNSLTIGTTETIPTGILTFNSGNRDMNIGEGGFVITANGDVTSAFNPTLTTAGDFTLNKVLTNQNFEVRMEGNPGLIISGTGTLGTLNVRQSTTNTGCSSTTNVSTNESNSQLLQSIKYHLVLILHMLLKSCTKRCTETYTFSM